MNLSEMQDKYKLTDKQMFDIGAKLGYSPMRVHEIMGFERGTYFGDILPAPSQKKHLQGQHDQSSHAHGVWAKGKPLRQTGDDELDDLRNSITGVRSSLDGKTKYVPNPGINTLDFIASAYNFTDEATGLKTKVSSIEEVDWGLEVRGDIFSEDGKPVGAFSRTVSTYGFVTHDLLTLEKHMGKFELLVPNDTVVSAHGFGKRWTQHLEETYVTAGFDGVKLDANLSVGGYAWARAGYEETGNFIPASRFLGDRRYSPTATANSSFAVYCKYEYGVTAITKSIQDIALFTVDGNAVGKEFLLGSSWEGYKKLDASNEGYQIGQSYYEQASSQKAVAGRKRTSLEPRKTQEFIGPGGDDSVLWGDIDSDIDARWRVVNRKHLPGQHPQSSHAHGKSPSGKPVSESLVVTGDSETTAAINRVVGLIGKIHGDGNLPTVSVEGIKEASTHNGAIEFAEDLVEVERISVYNDPRWAAKNHLEMTAAHEIGHLLDMRGMGEGMKKAATSNNTPEMRKFRIMVAASSECKQMKNMLDDPSAYETTVKVGYVDVSTTPSRQHLTYLLGDEEMFARAYAQYVAVKSGDPVMLTQIEELRKQTFYGLGQWSEENFKPIERALDGVFEAQGWIQ